MRVHHELGLLLENINSRPNHCGDHRTVGGVMVRSLKNRMRRCEICRKETVHEVCLDCKRGIDNNVRSYRDRQGPQILKPIHPSWLTPRLIQT